MRKYLIFLFSICFSIISCKKIIESIDSLGKEEFKVEDLKRINVNDEYVLSVPEYMTEMKSLHEDASLQYANVYKETYMVIIDEGKEEFINTFKELEIYNDSLSPLGNYADFQLKSFKESIGILKIKRLERSVKKLPSEIHQFNGSVEGIDIAYLVSFVEADKKMYMLMSWTLKNRYSKYKKTFKLIHSTFKLK
tara:strand:- start:796 stop:1377 length:582 start_codon:yes stop_codon:yes gene_type:complete